MSERELRRAAVLAQVKSGAWTLVEAAERMELSYRQSKRLWKCYQKHGAAGLVHGSAGRASNRVKPKKLRTKVVRLIRQKYSGEVGARFGPTLAAEHLASEDQIELSASTVRRWMLVEGLWSRARKVRQHRQRRARREHFCELVQFDGSFHEWLEGRGPRWGCCGPGWRSTACRERSTRIGKTCTCGNPRRKSYCTHAGSPVAEKLSRHESGGFTQGRRRRADFRGLGLRSALSARPKGLAGLRSGRGHGNPTGY